MLHRCDHAILHIGQTLEWDIPKLFHCVCGKEQCGWLEYRFPPARRCGHRAVCRKVADRTRHTLKSFKQFTRLPSLSERVPDSLMDLGQFLYMRWVVLCVCVQWPNERKQTIGFFSHKRMKNLIANLHINFTIRPRLQREILKGSSWTHGVCRLHTACLPVHLSRLLLFGILRLRIPQSEDSPPIAAARGSESHSKD